MTARFKRHDRLVMTRRAPGAPNACELLTLHPAERLDRLPSVHGPARSHRFRAWSRVGNPAPTACQYCSEAVASDLRKTTDHLCFGSSDCLRCGAVHYQYASSLGTICRILFQWILPEQKNRTHS